LVKGLPKPSINVIQFDLAGRVAMDLYSTFTEAVGSFADD